MSIISIKNLNFKYKNNIIFENLNLSIKENKITVILGSNGSGKTTLFNLIKKKNEKIKIGDDLNIKYLSQTDLKLTNNTVFEYISKVVENNKDSKIELNKTLKYLGLSNVLNEKINNLSSSDKQLLNFVCTLIYDPNLLIIDEAFNNVDPYKKDNVLKMLSDLKKDVTIIYLTKDIEDSMIADEIMVLGDKKVILKGSKDKVYSEEKVLNGLGFKLPFMIELSNRLKFYDLIDKNIYDMQKMVDTLWK